MNKLSCPEEVGFSTQGLSNIRSTMECYIEQGKIAGLTMLLAKKGNVVYNEHLGCQDLQSLTTLSFEFIL